MNGQEIIEMAGKVYGTTDFHKSALLHLEAFAKLVAAKEREACAKTCEELTFSKAGPSHDALRQRLLCAEAIRARGEA